METSGINIKIEKNNYAKGALNFQIFNPESGNYDEVNAFSDENRLLKYTSETRDLSEYAEEMLSVLINTYSRMKNIEIEYYGVLKDYDFLTNALKTCLKSNVSCIINPHCSMDPTALVERINQHIEKYNCAVNSGNYKDEYAAFIESTESVYEVSTISYIDNTDDPKEIVEAAENVIKQLSLQAVQLKEYISYVNKKIIQYKTDASKHDEEIANYNNTIFKKYFLKSTETLKITINPENIRNIEKKESDYFWNIWLDNAGVIFPQFNNNVIEPIKKKYMDKEKLSSGAICEYTHKICNDVYHCVRCYLLEKISAMYMGLFTDAFEIIKSEISETYGIQTDKMKLVYPASDICNNYIERAILNELSYIANLYDNGDVKVIKNVRRKGVSENYIKKQGYLFDINVVKYIDEYFNYESNSSFRIAVNKCAKTVLKKAFDLFETSVISVLKKIPKENDYVKETIIRNEEQCAKLQNSLSAIRVAAESSKNNIYSLVHSAKAGGNLK